MSERPDWAFVDGALELGMDEFAAKRVAEYALSLEAQLARCREALSNHGYGPGQCRCDWCAALATTEGEAENAEEGDDR